MDTDSTDFGFQKIPVGDKTRRVGEVFSSVARRYDLMNDLMSMGMHRCWKRFGIAICAVRPGHQVLDLAGGTGDLAQLLLRRVGEAGSVTLVDINADMLYLGRDRLIDQGLVGNIRYVQGNAECLPFKDNHFDAVTIAFGLRNVPDKARALASVNRVLRPGGQVLIMEFSQVVLPLLKRLYDTYSFNVLPLLGQLVAKDRASYQYLVESIRTFPDQQRLLQMLEQVGFGENSYNNLLGGIVAIHRGYKL